MKIAIVEDNKNDQKLIFESIQKYAEQTRIIAQISVFNSGETLLSSPNCGQFEILFLDIFLTGLNGMEIAKKIRQLSSDCLIVFVTATERFAVESYEVNALYYLLKPFTYENFCTVMERIGTHIKKKQLHIIVKSKGENQKIPLTKIVYADYYAHYVQIHTENTLVRTYMKFAEMQHVLLSHPEFLWCFRNIIINMSKVKKIEDTAFVLTNNERVPINRKMLKEIKEKYRTYMFEKLEDGS